MSISSAYFSILKVLVEMCLSPRKRRTFRIMVIELGNVEAVWLTGFNHGTWGMVSHRVEILVRKCARATNADKVENVTILNCHLIKPSKMRFCLGELAPSI